MKFDRFNAQWQSSPTRDRAAKFFLTFGQQEAATAAEYRQRFGFGVNHFIRLAFDLLARGQIDLKDVRGQRLGGLCEKLTKDHHDFLVGRLGFRHWSLRRVVVRRALEVLCGYVKRNGKLPMEPPRLRNRRSLPLQDGPVKDLNPSERRGVLRVRLHDNAVMELPYEVPKGMMQNKLALSDRLAGNLVSHQSGRQMFVARANVPFRWAYQPCGAVGTDFNRGGDDFITLSDGTRIASPEKVRKCVDLLRRLNRDLKDRSKTKNTRQRRGVRRKIQRAHKRLRRLCLPLAESLVSKTAESRSLLCIDGLTVGRSTGSFGHDKLVELLVKLCEKKGVPFVVVPTYHTSIVHHDCQRKAERPTVQMGCCPWCLCEYDAQVNAAKNIALWGWRIWSEGVKSFQSWAKQFATKRRTALAA